MGSMEWRRTRSISIPVFPSLSPFDNSNDKNRLDQGNRVYRLGSSNTFYYLDLWHVNSETVSDLMILADETVAQNTVASGSGGEVESNVSLVASERKERWYFPSDSSRNMRLTSTSV
jgi:hypothetical protein